MLMINHLGSFYLIILNLYEVIGSALYRRVCFSLDENMPFYITLISLCHGFNFTDEN